jgi:hypothetical protein
MTWHASTLVLVSAASLAACSGLDADRFTQQASGGAPASAGSSPAAGAVGEAGEASSAGSGGSAGAVAAGGALPAPPEGGAAGVPEPMPMCVAEVCNGRDDDCDGVADDGCPMALSTGNPVQRKALGDSPGGTVFADTCAADELLVGLSLGVGAWLDQSSAICQHFSLHTNTQVTPYRYSLGLGAKRSLAPHPLSTTSVVNELVCRDGTVMVGLRISQQHSAFGQVFDSVVIPQLAIRCAEPAMRLDPQNPRLEWQGAVEVGPVSGQIANSSAWFETDQLQSNELLVGFHGASGSWLDRLGLTASAVHVVLQSD